MADKVDANKILQHEIYLGRVNSGLINSVVTPSLEATYKAIRAILQDKGIPATQKQLAKLEADIAKAVRSNNAWSIYTDELNNVAIYEAGYTQEQVALIAASKAASDKFVIDYVNQQFISLESGSKVQTGLWPQFVQGNIDSQIKQINDIIRTGYAREQTLYQVGQNIRRSFEGVIKRDAETLARTGFAHYANEARAAWAESNADLDLYSHLVFTFDNRISDICRFISTGKTVFKLDDPKRRTPPFHFNCRTLEVFLPKGVELSGTRSSVGGQSGKEAAEAFDKRESRSDKKVKYRGKKDSNIFKPGQVKADTSYESWLRNQPAWFIDDVLGKTKGKAFRSGDKLSSFYDMTGRPLTLDELKLKG